MVLVSILPVDEHGKHNTITGNNLMIYPGYALIPNGMAFPASFPYADIEVRDKVVTKMTPLPVPDPTPEPTPAPTQLDRIEAQVAYTAMMTDTMMEG